MLGVCDQPHHLLGEEAGWQAGGLIKDGLKFMKLKYSVLHLRKEQSHATVLAGDDPNEIFLLEIIQLFKLYENKGLLCYLFCEIVLYLPFFK